MAIPFPERLIKRGERDSALVATIQEELARQGYGPFTQGVFDRAMFSVVRLFQSQHTDADGQPLLVDGEIGRHTWGALFGVDAVAPPSSAPSTLMLHALAIAGTQVGQMEVPRGSNRGPMVDEFLRSTGIDPVNTTSDQRAWCMCFVFWAFRTAAGSLQLANPLPRTAGCLSHWKRAKSIPGAVRIKAVDCIGDPSLVKPGLVFICDFGGGLGHTGIVERMMPGGHFMTIEGNTNDDGSRSGVGVFRLQRRKLADRTLVGFVDYTSA